MLVTISQLRRTEAAPISDGLPAAVEAAAADRALRAGAARTNSRSARWPPWPRRRGVQPSALIRFANALDFGGFTEMQQVFRARLLERSGSYRERIDAACGAAATRRRRTAACCTSSSASAWPNWASSKRTCAPPTCSRRGAADLRRRARARAGAAARLPGGLLPGLRAGPARTARRSCSTASAACSATVAAQIERGDVLLVASFQNYSPEVIEAARAGARARRAGDRHHRQRAVAAEAVGPRVLRARPGPDAGVPFAGGAAVPGAGAGGQRRASGSTAPKRAAPRRQPRPSRRERATAADAATAQRNGGAKGPP